jgi:hypothetical protein
MTEPSSAVEKCRICELGGNLSGREVGSGPKKRETPELGVSQSWSEIYACIRHLAYEACSFRRLLATRWIHEGTGVRAEGVRSHVQPAVFRSTVLVCGAETN